MTFFGKAFWAGFGRGAFVALVVITVQQELIPLIERKRNQKKE